MRVGVFPKPVEVAAKSPLQHPKHENRPQGHPRNDSIPIAIPPGPLLQEPEYRFPQFDIQVYVPQAAQKLGNVVSRPRVNPHIHDPHPLLSRIKAAQLLHTELLCEDSGNLNAPRAQGLRCKSNIESARPPIPAL